MAEIADGVAQGKRIEVWFQDEARVGQKNGITRRWARRGTRPSAPKDQRTASAYIFGAICPKEGKGAAIVMPRCNTAAMTAHLAEISGAVAADAHAVVLLDQAGWHTAKALEIPDNITLMPLPPRSPELNPTEQVWNHVKTHGVGRKVAFGPNQLKSAILGRLRKLQKLPGIICAFFKHPDCRYILG